jgi:hypothetical protein
VARLARLRLADGVPLAIERASLSEADLPDPEAVGASLYATLAERGRRPVRAVQRISATVLAAADADLLGVPPGSAGLRIERVSYLAKGRVLEFTRSLYRGDAYDFVGRAAPRPRCRQEFAMTDATPDAPPTGPTFMRAEVEDIPAAAERFLTGSRDALAEAAAAMRAADPGLIVTVARGSSDHAATYLKYAAELVAGVPVASVGPSVASVYGRPACGWSARPASASRNRARARTSSR